VAIEALVDWVTSLIIGAEFISPTTLSGILAMVMAHVQPIAINYAMFVNRFATNALKTAQIRSWWYEALAMINPAQRNSDPPRAYIVSAK